ncbi:hypothetical protein FA95DRAFT_1519035 [Auriscalpium vulgare]|uniref:Uncharacterized protein n=1 Tax=Auriscalpium vulgare TaxID=40419 RepID=A0ACB8RT49_9AGAM|nr:hypothetical protein FA95DRAFT_1519035 [Auriscalpium vulgare]
MSVTLRLRRPLDTLHRRVRPPCQRRTIFSLPNLSSFSPFGDPDAEPPDPQTYHERKILPYTRKQLYDVVADVASYSSFIPFCTQSRVLNIRPSARLPDATILEGELTVSFLTFKESYVSEVTCRPYESVQAVASSATPLFKSLSTTWRFQPSSPRSPHSSTHIPINRENHHHNSTHPTSSSPITSTSSGDVGPTLLTLDLQYAFANPVHAAVSGAFFGQVSKLMVRAFEERCIAVYGRGSR